MLIHRCFGIATATAAMLFATQPLMAEPAPSCVMHVWASPKIQNDISGFFPGGALKALETGGYADKLRRGNSTVTQTLLTPELLLAALKDSRMGAALDIPSNGFILEPGKATLQPFIKQPVTGTEGCRYGFNIWMITFQKSMVYGKRIFVFYEFIDRTTGPNARKSRGYNREDLKAFDPGQTSEQIAPILEDGVRRVIDDIVIKKLAAKPTG